MIKDETSFVMPLVLDNHSPRETEDSSCSRESS